MKAIFHEQYRNIQIFPKHPDSYLGTIIHLFYSNKNKWKINNENDFEEKWNDLIHRVNEKFITNDLQNGFYPIEWHSKFYIIKKQLLKNILLSKSNDKKNYLSDKISFEKWYDDGKDVGGYIDYIKYNNEDEIIEIIDFKSGKIFENKNKKKHIKLAYKYQLALYAKLIFLKQHSFPKSYLQDLKGNNYLVNIDEVFATKIYERAKNLKYLINQNIINNTIEKLPRISNENCSFCNYRPYCKKYKELKLNDFSDRKTDVFGRVENITLINGKQKVNITINGDTYLIENISNNYVFNKGQYVYIYNLFLSNTENKILYPLKTTSLFYE